MRAKPEKALREAARRKGFPPPPPVAGRRTNMTSPPPQQLHRTPLRPPPKVIEAMAELEGNLSIPGEKERFLKVVETIRDHIGADPVAREDLREILLERE